MKKFEKLKEEIVEVDLIIVGLSIPAILVGVPLAILFIIVHFVKKFW